MQTGKRHRLVGHSRLQNYCLGLGRDTLEVNKATTTCNPSSGGSNRNSWRKAELLFAASSECQGPIIQMLEGFMIRSELLVKRRSCTLSCVSSKHVPEDQSFAVM